jgi:nucleoside-diphosphate-sugar epimerase
MTHLPFGRLTSAMVLRIVADAVMVNAALFFSLVSRYLWSLGVEGKLDTTLGLHVQAYASTFWMLTPMCTTVFYLSGMYTHGRAYRGRYKALVVIQAVSLSFLIFGFVLFLLRDLTSFPRSTVVLAWLLTLVLVLGARLWMALWTALVQTGHPTAGSEFVQGKKEKVLVIGGAGYIGSALVERLLELDYQVRVLDLLLYQDNSIAEFLKHPAFELVQGDFRQIDTVVHAAQGVDSIVHLGAIVGDSACALCEDLTIEINLRATGTIAEVGKGFGVKRFVFASTCSVYGASDEILNERSVLRPISLYARTKMESEKLLLNMADSSFAPTILRFGTIYGLSHRPRFDLVVNLLAAKAIQDGEVGIFGGRQWRPLVHVKDVAAAIVLTLQAPRDTVSGQIFNVGSNEQNYQIADLGRIIKEMVPAANLVTQPIEDNRNYRVRFDKIHNMLNFQPRYTVQDGVAEIVNAFASGRITDYRKAQYSNFGFLKQNNELRQILLEDVGSWDWVKLSAIDAQMLTEVVMAVIDSGSRDLMGQLRDSLVQVILGDVDGFIEVLTGMQLGRPPQPATAGDRLTRFWPRMQEIESEAAMLNPSPA